MDRLERLTNLVALLLTTARPVTLDEIAGELGYPASPEARRAQFERDKRLLRDEGVPVETVALPGGGSGYRINADEYYLALDLDEGERVALNLAMAAVRLESGWARDATWKLGGAPGTDLPALAFLSAVDSLPRLFDGWRRRATVTFTYRGRERRLDPYGLLFRNGFWYAVGRDHEHDTIRVYRADRIEGDVATGAAGAFEPPAGFDAGAALPDQAFRVGDGEVESVDVLIDEPHAAAVVAELGDGAVVERRDNAVVVRVEVTNRAGFRAWLFGLLDHAEVLGPPDVRKDVVAWLEEMADAETTG